MKAAAFDYVRADHLAHALELLTEHGDEAKLIAGGQSLVPMMAMRLARPSLLVDIHRLTELQGMECLDNHVRLGAGVRQSQLERHAQVCAKLPLVQQAIRWVGHQQTRHRGTVGGSLAYADPSAELPLSALILNATLHLQNPEGIRQVQAADFFLGPMFTALSETECLTHIDWPVWSGDHVGCAFEETAIRQGDFAMASAACQLQCDAQGRIIRLSLGAGGVGGTPLVFSHLTDSLKGQTLNHDSMQALAQQAASECEPGSDMHASAAYRTHLVAVLMNRVLQQAYAQASQTQKATT